jgi:hypothetical protein
MRYTRELMLVHKIATGMKMMVSWRNSSGLQRRKCVAEH